MRLFEFGSNCIRLLNLAYTKNNGRDSKYLNKLFFKQIKNTSTELYNMSVCVCIDYSL